MSAARKPRVGILASDDDRAASLVEWMRAAGFEPLRADTIRDDVDALLVRWSFGLDLGGAVAPIVVLVDRGGAVPSDVEEGAAKVIELPDDSDVNSLLTWSTSLMQTLKDVTGSARSGEAAAADPGQGEREAVERGQPAPEVIAIGVSTGGPEALPVLFRALAGHALPPIAIVQHIPGKFLQPLVDRLVRESGYPIRIAERGSILGPGGAWFAPGDQHMRIVRRDDGTLATRLTDEPPVRGHRPAAEILFESCAELPLRGLGVLMTGMGRDGAQALLELRRRGWATLGQDRESCAIYGMPMVARELGAIGREVPLDDLGRWIAMLCRSRRSVSAS